MKNKAKIKYLFITLFFIIALLPMVVNADTQSYMSDTTRNIFIDIDAAIYGFFGTIFALFNTLANAQFLTGSIYSVIFKRVFLILAVFMLFKLTFSFLTYLISPDSMTDPRNEGNVNKLIGRVVVSILFLIALVPIGTDTPYAKESGIGAVKEEGYEKNIQDQGILFGTLQTVQDAILDNNVIGQLILGSSASKVKDDSNMQKNGEAIEMTVFSAFFRINEEAAEKGCDSDYSADALDKYYIVPNFTVAKENANKLCPLISNDKEVYLFEYDVFISTIIGLLMVVLTFLFTFDVALRAIKLSILRLIAPIPAISYINPKSAKDGAFANYTKVLMSTYLDLFLRIAIINITVLLISALTSGNTKIIGDQYSGMARVIVIIALLFFAAQAPRFIMQALGIKSTGTGLGFGAGLLGGALAGTIAGAASGGIGGAVKGFFGGAGTGASNYSQASAGQKPNMSAWKSALNKGAQLGSGDPNAKSFGVLGIAAGKIGSALTGTTAKRIKSAEDKYFEDQKQLNSRQRLASALGLGTELGSQEWDFLTTQTYANGRKMAELDATTGKYKFYNDQGVEIGGSYSTNPSDIRAIGAALAFDNDAVQKGLGKRSNEIEKAKKQNAFHDQGSQKPKYTAFKKFKK